MNLFRIDILNCIGVSMMLDRRSSSPRASGSPQSRRARGGSGFVALGPIIGPAHFPTFIPRPLSSYVGGQRPCRGSAVPLGRLGVRGPRRRSRLGAREPPTRAVWRSC